jgi:hypothetical protein
LDFFFAPLKPLKNGFGSVRQRCGSGSAPNVTPNTGLEGLTINAEVASVLLGPSQHPPRQRNLRGGGISCSVEYNTVMIFLNLCKYLNHKYRYQYTYSTLLIKLMTFASRTMAFVGNMSLSVVF